jgi:hypothetical protein
VSRLTIAEPRSLDLRVPSLYMVREQNPRSPNWEIRNGAAAARSLASDKRTQSSGEVSAPPRPSSVLEIYASLRRKFVSESGRFCEGTAFFCAGAEPPGSHNQGRPQRGYQGCAAARSLASDKRTQSCGKVSAPPRPSLRSTVYRASALRGFPRVPGDLGVMEWSVLLVRRGWGRGSPPRNSK